MVAQGKLGQLLREYHAVGQRMVFARTEFLEANAEELAQLAEKFPDDRLIVGNAKKAIQDLLDWNVKIGVIVEEKESTDTIDETGPSESLG